MIAAAHAALDRYGAGSGSARLIVGARLVHDELERRARGMEATKRSARCSPPASPRTSARSPTLAGADTLVCSDELNHASIIDGCRLSRADVAVYRHGDLDELAALLRERDGRRAIVVSDTVFSMDGDLADVDGLVALSGEHDALLVLDEAHAVLGPHPDVDALAAIPHLRVGTLSKTLGALGGFVAGPRRFIDLLVNLARSYIFTTAPTPADSAAALAAVRVLRSAEGETLVARLARNVARLSEHARSPIVPVAVRRRPRRARRRRGAPRTWVPRARDPATDRAARDRAAAHRVQRSTHRRAGRRPARGAPRHGARTRASRGRVLTCSSW